MVRLILLSALLLCVSPRALASEAEPTGLDLLERCHALRLMEEAEQPPDEEILRNYGYCLGFMVGYVSGFAARDAAGAAGRFCPPADARIADFVDAVDDWLVVNPQGLEQMGALVALRAFQWRFPCPQPHPNQ